MNDAKDQKLPRISYLIGGENDPLKTGKTFIVKGYIGQFRIENECIEWDQNINVWIQATGWQTCKIINHPENLILPPHWSEDEIDLFRAFYAKGYRFWLRGGDGELWACENEPSLYASELTGRVRNEPTLYVAPSTGNIRMELPLIGKSHHLDSSFLPHLPVRGLVDVAELLKAEEPK